MMNVRDGNTKKEKETGSKKTNSSKSSTSRKTTASRRVKELEQEIEKFKKEIDSYKDKYLRTVAEFENYKKRKDKETVDIIERANQHFFLDLLPVIDDFERSLNSVSTKKSYKLLKQGIDLIYQKLTAVLKKQGIESIDSIGRQFDPELHAAIMQVDVEDKPSNIVIDEALKGYRLRDKVLRYSQVVVNK